MDSKLLIPKNLQLLILQVLFTAGFLVQPALSDAQQPCTIKPDPAKRKEWLLQTQAKMLEFSLEAPVARLTAQFDKFETNTRITYQVGKEGVIYFADNDWIYIVSSNSHDQPEVGDLTVAMDQDHNFYLNRGHVCGGQARYFCDDLKEITTSATFFSSFKEDIDMQTWTRWAN